MNNSPNLLSESWGNFLCFAFKLQKLQVFSNWFPFPLLSNMLIKFSDAFISIKKYDMMIMEMRIKHFFCRKAITVWQTA